jgi:hypothetical protein
MSKRDDDIASALPKDLDALPRLNGFRLRGMEMTRLETFIDAAALVLANTLPPNRISWGWIYFSLAILVLLHRWFKRRPARD